MGFYDLRFEPSTRKLKTECARCHRAMWFPPSHHGRYKTCGKECSLALSSEAKQLRERPCKVCGRCFIPRAQQVNSGLGIFCSKHCSIMAIGHLGRTPLARAKSAATRASRKNTGVHKDVSGRNSASWRGGRAESVERNKHKRAEWTRKYRAKNPEKTREFKKKRAGRIVGSLPRGTVKKIGESQRWLCVGCRRCLKRGYHLDHIVALANGGKHEPFNLQLLCGPCNVKKSAKNPVDFMQSMGFLL